MFNKTIKRVCIVVCVAWFLVMMTVAGVGCLRMNYAIDGTLASMTDQQILLEAITCTVICSIGAPVALFLFFAIPNGIAKLKEWRVPTNVDLVL